MLAALKIGGPFAHVRKRPQRLAVQRHGGGPSLELAGSAALAADDPHRLALRIHHQNVRIARRPDINQLAVAFQLIDAGNVADAGSGGLQVEGLQLNFINFGLQVRKREQEQ